ncbi:DUF599 domain-containing protein [Parasulfitobacter algicola]|uniref:DUF599 domain-containing protein n=1 Tax=Parasulfitobacter algicola TaxID=2614809 RepID=A0ABX2ILX2_9RHOB|nr:DUF599 domain-containing protein [Sulfitobacter algicola]NSX53881.1 DUF599 domain-containing protein [Sulfitobacter algicola]
MIMMDIIKLFTVWDGLAVSVLFISWIGMSFIIERTSNRHLSVSLLMNDYRRNWMKEFVTREPRIFDAQIMANLRQGTAFFVSACMIAIGGGIAVIGNTEQLLMVADDFAVDQTPAVVVEIKLVVTLLFMTNAFLKFVWAHRLFGYCSIVMASVPNDITDPIALTRAEKAAEINITAARGFNRGMRSIYFAFAAAAWLLGTVALAAATVITVLVIWRREFASHSRAVLMEDDNV